MKKLLLLLLLQLCCSVSFSQDGYSALSYIENKSDAYINTGYTHKTTTRVEMECEINSNTGTANAVLFGGRTAATNADNFTLFAHQENQLSFAGTFDFGPFNPNRKMGAAAGNVPTGEKVKITVSKADGVKIYTNGSNDPVGTIAAITGTAGDGTKPLYIFDLNDNNNKKGWLTHMKLYRFKIYEGETLVHDYVPRLRNTDRVAGLYDNVTNTFLQPAGTTSFEYAFEQNLTIIDDLASYTGTDATVFNKADGKVYKYNSMGLYEQYGVYEVVDFTAPQATEVEYITNAGNSDLIIPDYRPKANTRVFATVEIASTANTRTGVFGTREYKSGWPNAFYFETVSDNKVHAKLGNEADFDTDGTPFVGVKSVFDLNGTTGQSNVYVNGATIASHTWTRWADDYDYKYFLTFFAVRQNNTACYNYQPANMKLYGAKIYEGNTLVMDLVPVVTSNGKGGLKDRLTGSIYTNGNGTISASGSYSVSGADKGVSTYEGKLVYNTADNHMYHWNGSAWEDKGLGLQEISDTKYYKFYDNTANAWNWFYPGATYDNTFAGYKTDVSATYGARANHNDAQIGAGGFEPLQYNLTCFENGANYRLSFDFTTDGFSSYSTSIQYLPLYLYAGNYGNVGSWGYLSEHIKDANTWAYVQVPFNAQSNWHIARNFTATGDKAGFIFQFGAVTDGGDGFKFWFDNIYIQKYLYPATYPAISLTSAIDALLEEAEAWTQPMTTDDYWTELSAAKADAETYRADDDLTKQKEVLDALQTALDHVNAVGDITYLRPTVALAEDEGIDVTAEKAFIVSGTTSGVPVLNALRVKRQIKAKGHHDAFTGSEPTVGETYYLYNVGQGLFLCPSLVGAHELALGFAGDPLTLESNTTGGYQLKGTIRADKYIGHQWGSQGFFDGAANAAATNWYFFPVTGTTNVYNISKADNTNNGNLLGYAPEATPTYGIGERDGSQDWGMRVLHNRSGVDDAKNQWILVTKAERDALLETATAANGVDATYYIVDPAIDHNHALQTAWQASEGNLDVWGDWIQYGPADANFCITNEGVSISQELTGLKPGIYSVGVQAVYMHPSDFSLSNAELFATNGAGETKTQAIAARNAGLDQVPGMGVLKAEGWLPASNRFINYWSGDGYNGAAYYFHYGQYWNEVANVVPMMYSWLTTSA